MDSVFVLVTAAGMGTRLGYDMAKALVKLEGRTLVERAVDGVRAVPEVAGIVVTAPSDVIGEFEKLFEGAADIRIVPGASERQGSVYNGLRAIPGLAKDLGVELRDETPVLIHDAARCLTPPRVISDVISVLRDGYTAVIPALPVTDTQKIVDPDPAATSGIKIEKVTGQVDRTQLRAVQTPQGFHWGTIIHAHEVGHERYLETGESATDDGGLVETLGGEVYLSEGSQMSMKITTKLDMIIATELLRRDKLADEK